MTKRPASSASKTVKKLKLPKETVKDLGVPKEEKIKGGKIYTKI